MATIEQNILLNAVGGDGAAAQVEKVNSSFKNVENTHDQLQEKFGHKFQHLGLQMFAGEALRASGVGRETREVVGILNMAVTTMSSTMGGAIGPIIALVSAFGVLAGIVQKVREHNKDLSDQLDKTNKSFREQLAHTNELINSIQNYEKEVGVVPGFLKRWEDAERNLSKAQVERLITGDKAQIASLTLLMNQESRRQEQMRDEIADQEKLVKSLRQMGVDMGLVNVQSQRLTTMQKTFKDSSIAVQEHKAQIDGLIAEVSLLSTHGTSDLNKLAEAHKKAAEEARKAADEAKKINDQEAEEETRRYQHWAELHAKTLITRQELDEKYNKQMKDASMSVFTDISKNVADSFVAMALHGKSFVDSFTQGFQRMAEQILADIIRIKIEWAILTAMTPGLGMAGGGGFKLFGMAEGGSVLVNKPTMFLAGEAGQPEVATFTPLSKMGSGNGGGLQNVGGGSQIQIGSIQVNAYEVQDADQLATQVGRKIVERIRGMGELNFTRSS